MVLAEINVLSSSFAISNLQKNVHVLDFILREKKNKKGNLTTLLNK